MGYRFRPDLYIISIFSLKLTRITKIVDNHKLCSQLDQSNYCNVTELYYVSVQIEEGKIIHPCVFMFSTKLWIWLPHVVFKFSENDNEMPKMCNARGKPLYRSLINTYWLVKILVAFAFTFDFAVVAA